MTASHTAPRRAAPALVIALAAQGVLGTLGACKRGGAAAEAPGGGVGTPATMTVGPENVTVVARDQVSSGPTLSGSLTPERSATLRAQVGGTVTAVLAEAGQSVRRGQSLARVETNGIAEQAVSARTSVAAARANYDVAARNADRAERLLAAGAIAPQAAEQARAAAEAARAQLSGAQAQSSLASTQLGRASVEAPFNGIVGTRSVNVGDVVAPGAALYTVVDPGSMQLTGSVPADQLGQVRVGAPVQFTVTGYPGRDFTGRITRVSPVADPSTRQVQVIASVPNAGGQLVGGLFAQGRVTSETRDALVVPADAVSQRGVRPVVVRGGRAETVPVELGIRDEATERIEVRGPIAAGDTLLRGAAQGVTAGTPVRISAPNDRGSGARTVPAVGGAGGGATGGTGGGTGGAAQGSRTNSGS